MDYLRRTEARDASVSSTRSAFRRGHSPAKATIFAVGPAAKVASAEGAGAEQASGLFAIRR
jgi:hypothetical protein